MPVIIQIIADGPDKYSVYRNDVLLVYNIDYNTIIGCASELKSIKSDSSSDNNSKLEVALSPVDSVNSRIKRPGRSLVLAPHIDIVWDMIDRDPHITAKGIKKRLHSLGIGFASATAVENLARRYGLKLAA